MTSRPRPAPATAWLCPWFAPMPPWCRGSSSVVHTHASTAQAGSRSVPGSAVTVWHVASKNSSGSSVKDQKSAAREKVRAMQEAQRRKDRRTRALIISAGAVVAAILITIGVFAITNVQQENAAKDANLSKVVEPAGVTDTGGITAAGPDGAEPPVKVVEYLDYQCPACKQFDLAVGPYLKEQVAAGTVELEYHPVNFLNGQSGGTRYSSRSGNAAYCTATNGGDIAAFSDTLYAEQPPEGGQGLPDEDLVKAARDAGASAEVEQCIADETYTGYVTQQNDEAFAKEADGGVGIGGTPAIFIDGKMLEDNSLAGVQAAIEAAQA